MDIIIETPKGSSEKYKYDPGTKIFRLKKILPAGFVFPYAFGFIPFTKGEDGDPLDVLVISEIKGFPGCIMGARIIGCIKVKEKKGENIYRNDRFLAVVEGTREYDLIYSTKDLPDKLLEELQSFITFYIEAEGKKSVKVLGTADAEEALSMIPVTISEGTEQ